MKDLTYIAIIALTGFIAFQSGQLWKFHQLKPTIIQYDGAHYSMTTGDFVWGKAPMTYDPEQMANQLSESVMPAKKVKGGK